VKIRRFSNYLTLRNRPVFMPGIVRRATTELKHFDIIHMHGYRGFHYLVLWHYARKHDIPYIVDAHNPPTKRTWGGLRWLVDTLFARRILRNATMVITETEKGTREYLKIGVNKEKISVLYPPFLVEDCSPVPPRGGLRQRFGIKEPHIIAFLGRIAQVKGLGFLIEAFYELSRQRDDTMLVIVGSDDGYRSNIERIIERLKLSNKVLFTGFLHGKDKLSALVDADMVVQPSVNEYGLPKPCIEATLCGTPFVVTAGTGAAEIVRQMDIRYIVEYGNNHGLREMMQHILDNPDEVANSVQKAKSYIMENLSLDKRIVDYEKIYAICMEQAQSANLRYGE